MLSYGCLALEFNDSGILSKLSQDFFLISFNYGYILAIVFNLFDCDDLNAFTISCDINQNVYVCVSMFSKALGGRQAVGGG